MAVSPELASYAPVVALHVAGGGIGLLAGAAALVLRKGSRLHGLAGKTFFAGMTVMAAFGAVLGILGPQKFAAGAGLLAFYLIATGWMAVLRRERRVGGYETGALALALSVIAISAGLGLVAAAQPDGELGGQPAVRYYILASIAGLAGLMDLSVILRRGIAGAHRIARHLWRMCFALFIAATTFFPQQPDIFVGVPTLLLIIPSLSVLAAMLIWLGVAYFTRRFRRAA